MLADESTNSEIDTEINLRVSQLRISRRPEVLAGAGVGVGAEAEEGGGGGGAVAEDRLVQRRLAAGRAPVHVRPQRLHLAPRRRGK